ncbi:MAG: hypothetical protein ACRBN8_40865 [Nannocystales bacterium]
MTVRGVKARLIRPGEFRRRDHAEETDASVQQIRSAIARLVARLKVRFKGKMAARCY